MSKTAPGERRHRRRCGRQGRARWLHARHGHLHHAHDCGGAQCKLPYDPVKDFAPVAIVGISPYVLVIHPKVPANNIAELIALAKAKPRTLSYSSVGNASQGHLAAELFAAMAGVELNHIPYKTSTHAVIDLNEGRIDMQFGILGSSLALIREGKLRALAVTTPQRLEDVPDVQTMIEAGLPGYDVSLVFAVVMPAGTPRPIVARLNREISEFVATPELKRVLAAQAIQPCRARRTSCASASPRKSRSGAASRRRPASSRNDPEPRRGHEIRGEPQTAAP
jgi:tripartite-type tricarboxylate transporter receptor subunit TctC